MLGVALKEADAVSGGLALLGKALIDGLERGRAVVLRFPCSEQIQVGTVQYQNFSHERCIGSGVKSRGRSGPELCELFARSFAIYA